MIKIAIPPIPDEPPKNRDEAFVRVGNETLKVLIESQEKYGLTAMDLTTIAWTNVMQFYKALAIEVGKDDMANIFHEIAKRLEEAIRTGTMQFDWEKQLQDGK